MKKYIIGIIAGVVLAYSCFIFKDPEHAETVAKGYSILLGSIIECIQM